MVLVVHYSADAYITLQGQLAHLSTKNYIGSVADTLNHLRNRLKIRQTSRFNNRSSRYRSVVLPQVFIYQIWKLWSPKGSFRGLNFAKHLGSGFNPLTTWADLPGQACGFTAWNSVGVGIHGVIAKLGCGLGDLLWWRKHWPDYISIWNRSGPRFTTCIL